MTQPIPSESLGDSPRWERTFEQHKKGKIQQLKEDEEKVQEEDVFTQGHFIDQSHVKYLESAGARVIPVDFSRDENELAELLSQINGLYIPGDSKKLMQPGKVGEDFIKGVRKVLKWAQAHNEKESHHFPILGVGYGMLAMLKSQITSEIQLEAFTPKPKLQQNLVHDPKHTYLYDETSKEDVEKLFDKIKFWTDAELGMRMEDMVLEHKTISGLFMPVCTFDDQSLKN